MPVGSRNSRPLRRVGLWLPAGNVISQRIVDHHVGKMVPWPYVRDTTSIMGSIWIDDCAPSPGADAQRAKPSPTSVTFAMSTMVLALAVGDPLNSNANDGAATHVSQGENYVVCEHQRDAGRSGARQYSHQALLIGLNTASSIRVFDVVRALSFVGDLSMGQPIDHSIRAAWISDQIAVSEKCSTAERRAVRQAALLRWSGCTATANGFAALFGDDVSGREAMLSARPEWSALVQEKGGMDRTMVPLAQIHCEVSREVARMLNLDEATEQTLFHLWEAYDGSGMPNRLEAERIPPSVFMVSLAGDLEIFSRVYGIDRALQMIARRAGVNYPLALVRNVTMNAERWLTAIKQEPSAKLHDMLLTEEMKKATSVELVADIIDLKLPWMTGFSRRVANAAADCSVRLGLAPDKVANVYHAGLIHGIGRASTPNDIWNVPGPLSEAAWEKVRLAPYWTLRAGKQIDRLNRAAEIASFTYERADGSGYFRGSARQSIPVEGHIVAVAAAWVALRSDRPWRAAISAESASAHIRGEAQLGRFDPEISQLVTESLNPRSTAGQRKGHRASLSKRELEVLRHVSYGASNKETARVLGLSPSTVRTHVESIFRKLDCSTRAAATLKASTLGLL